MQPVIMTPCANETRKKSSGLPAIRFVKNAFNDAGVNDARNNPLPCVVTRASRMHFRVFTRERRAPNPNFLFFFARSDLRMTTCPGQINGSTVKDDSVPETDAAILFVLEVQEYRIRLLCP